MKIFETLIRSGVIAVLGFAFAGPWTARSAHASEADFFKGKTIRISVGVAPGGGYDAHARMLAPLLAAKIGATVIVENRPGAGGMAALNTLIKDPPDGLRMMLLNGEGAVLSKLVDLPNLRFDLATLVYLGRMSYENRVLIAASDTPFAKIDGFRSAKSTIIMGTGGRIDSMGDAESIFCYALDLRCKLITGYSGSAEVTLALLRGEVQAQVTSESQVAKLIMSDKKLVAVATLNTKRAPLLRETPTIFELTKMAPESAKWLKFRAGIADIGRSLVMAPKTPPARAKYLEDTLRSILTDPKVIADAEKHNRPIDYAPPDETRKVIRQIFTELTQPERAEIQHIILKAY